MAQITHDMLPELSLEDAWELANSIPIDFYAFANAVSLYARMYGVLTGAQEGSKPPKGSSITDKYNGFIANSCAVQNTWRKLFQVTVDTESRLNYCIRDEGYFVEDIPFPESGVMMLRLPGVAKLNVKRGWSDIILTGSVSPYFALNATVTFDGTVPIVHMSRDYVSNPNNVFMRKNSDDGAYKINEAYGVSRSATEWEVPVDTNSSGYDVAEQINLQHKKYVWVDIAEPTLPVGLPADSVFVPVYPDTNQIIPHEWEQVDASNRRYRFPIYALVDPAFMHREVNLINAEFYKLLETVEFKYYYDEDAPLEAVYEIGNTQLSKTLDDTGLTVPPYLTADLVEGSYGKIQLLHKNTANTQFITLDELSTFLCGDDPDVRIQNIRVRIYYKCTPDSLPEKLTHQLPSVRDAIVWKTAAELPIESCECSMTELGLIAEAQQVYADTFTNVFSGTTVSRFNYGDRHGQVVWATTMNNARIYSRPQFLNKRYTRRFVDVY